eukprot:TRINITY_DN3675_c0_g1_i4.p2 TRINITY_DN3675_c0_g1~~TRINITY_DN3675_c0_g1_i4.p2  ORF type:complete len:145 (+),score=29.57 TRINITY_DN3675_c0_g1_i4:467-901(+)
MPAKEHLKTLGGRLGEDLVKTQKSRQTVKAQWKTCYKDGPLQMIGRSVGRRLASTRRNPDCLSKEKAADSELKEERKVDHELRGKTVEQVVKGPEESKEAEKEEGLCNTAEEVPSRNARKLRKSVETQTEEFVYPFKQNAEVRK